VDNSDWHIKGFASLEEHRADIDGLNQPDFHIVTLLGRSLERAARPFGTELATAFEAFAFGPNKAERSGHRRADRKSQSPEEVSADEVH
jgi:hypothetical protein